MACYVYLNEVIALIHCSSSNKGTWFPHAQPLLKLDLPRYLKKKKKGGKIKTRAEYKLFKLKTFRKHLYQEIKMMKFHNYVKAKAEAKKAGKKKIEVVVQVGAGFVSDDDSSSDESQGKAIGSKTVVVVRR